MEKIENFGKLSKFLGKKSFLEKMAGEKFKILFNISLAHLKHLEIFNFN